MRGAIALAAALGFAACYSASPASGVPCSMDGNCPGDQKCDFGRSPPTCVDELPDAGPGPDAATSCVDNSQCIAGTPICDPVGKFCRGCTADTECAGACSESRGTCVEEARVLFVDSVSGMDLAPCTRQAPCRTIAQAVARVDATLDFIRIAKGSYIGQVKVQIAGELTISGEDDNPSDEVLTSTVGAILQHDQGTLVLEGLTLAEAPGDGIQSKAALTAYRLLVTKNNNKGIDHQGNNLAPLVVRSSSITGNNNEGISAQDAPATITRCYIAGNGGGGVRANRSALTMLNTFVVQNGMPLGGSPGVRIQNINNNPQRFEFNTIAGNVGGGTISSGVVCESPVTLRSSILADNGNLAPQMSGCAADHTLFSAGAPNGMGNKNGNPAFVDATNGDFHILPSSEAVGRAGDMLGVTDDFDGDTRAGAEIDCGADELP